MVPGINDSKKEIRAIARFVKRGLGLSKIDLHLYNKLGEGKYEHLDKPKIHLDPQSDEVLKVLREVVSSECPGEPP